MTNWQRLTHRTEYRYQPTAWLSPQEVRLAPKPSDSYAIRDYRLAVEPEGASVRWQSDAEGNRVAVVRHNGEVALFAVTVSFEVLAYPVNPFDFILRHDVISLPVAYTEEERLALTACLESPHCAELDEWLAEAPVDRSGTVAALASLCAYIHTEIAYARRYAPGVHHPLETLSNREGSCRDLAWLMVCACRCMGLAARFVSGYDTDPPEAFRDALELHAWMEVYLPGGGWIGCDPSQGLLTTGTHVALACSAWPERAAPIIGVHSRAQAEFGYAMTLERVP